MQLIDAVHSGGHPSNIVDCLVQGLGYTYIDGTFAGAWERFWPGAFPASTTDSYGYQWALNPGLLVQLHALTTAPPLLLTYIAKDLLHCALSLSAQCIVIGPVWVCLCVCLCWSVTMTTRNCMH